MKKSLFFSLVVLFGAIAASCSKELGEVPAMKTISVEMGCAQGDLGTKTQLVDGKHVYWTAADKNLICFTNNCESDQVGYDLTSTLGGLVPTKTFTGQIPAGDEPLFYVYDRNRKTSASTHNFKFKRGSSSNYLTLYSDPDQRIGTAPWGNTFHIGCNYAVAKPGDPSFRHVFGFIKWTNNGTAIKYVKMEPLVSTENIVGAVQISYDNNGDLVFSNAYNSSINYIYSGIQASQDNSKIPADNSYYAIVYPRAYHGMKVTVTLADGTSFALKTLETLLVESGKYVDLGVLPKEPVTTVTGSCTLTPGGDFEPGWTMTF